MILLTILLVVFVIISIVLILGISFLGWSFWLLFGDLVVFIGIIVSIIISIIKNKKDKSDWKKGKSDGQNKLDGKRDKTKG